MTWNGRRVHAFPATLFAAAALAFLLPFGTVSCGTPVTFTGLELATADVDGAGQGDAEIGADIEHRGSPVALVALVATMTGLGLALFGSRVVGWPAVAGLFALMLLPWLTPLADFTVRSGWVLAVAAHAAAFAMALVGWWRRRTSTGRRRWPAVVAGALVAALLGLTIALSIAASVSFEG